MIPDLEEYVARYCEAHNITREEAITHQLVFEIVKQASNPGYPEGNEPHYYRSINKKGVIDDRR